MTQPEINALAIDLGITREAWPEFYYEGCNYPTYRCTLPSPDSDDPRAVLWEPFLMRALDWPKVYRFGGAFNFNAGKGQWADTPTAALYAAWKEMKK